MIPKVAKASLRKASRKSVEDTYSLLKAHFRHQRWIGKGNRYRVKCTDSLFKDTQPGQTINDRHLAQYIAASAPVHCADGWSLLGRALDCHARGDFEASRHLAYYAELRAALSLLAAEGIGIFDDRHFVIRTSTDCPHVGNLPKANRRGGLATHRIAWAALEHWADLKRSAELLGRIVSVAGLSLAEWLTYFQTGPGFHPIGSRWLKTWGLDLKRMSDDRESRNEASYRPSRFIPRNPSTALEASEFMCSFWDVCEPAGRSRFEILDRHLLRLTLEELFLGITGNTVQQDAGTFKSSISSMINRAGLAGARQEEWLKFLTRNVHADDPPILVAAKRAAEIDDVNYHLQVISRAALLLRVATGGCGRILIEANLSKDTLKFWWASLGQDRGLWDVLGEPNEFVDLWADAEAAVRELRAWHAANATQNPSFARWRTERPYEISALGACERVALWGLGL